MSMSKHMKRSGVVAWCPHKEHADLLACGTAAGSISDFGASAAQLEIFTLTTSDAQDRTMPVLGTTEVNERFHCLAWGKGTSPYGLIAGGMANGSVLVANPGSIAKGEKDTIFSVTEKHSGPVQGLDFNPSQPNLLASGGAEAEINIWDVTSPSAPKNYTPGAKAQQQTDITCLQWNPTVAHILASAAYNGVSVIWDLRAKRPVITFSDPSKKTKCRAMAWNPVEPMQIVTASEEDSSPVIQVWDLRNTYSPSKYLEGHTKGIWSVSWCPLDPGLLLSCGKHTEVFCWNMQTGKVQCEVETTNSWNSNVQWAPHIPSIFSICSLEGQIKVFSLQDPTPRIMGGGSTRHVDFSHPPKWLKKPVGASFGFGGKLFSFSQKTGPGVNVRTLVTDPEFVSRADRLEKVIESGDFKHFCEEKAQEAALPRDKQMWSLMKVLFETDARSSLLAELEYGAEAIKQHIAEVLANMPEPASETKDATPPSSKGKEKEEVEKVKEEEAKPQETVNDVFSEQEEKKELDEPHQDEPIPFGEKGGDVSDFFGGGGGFGGQAAFNVGSATEGEGDLFANLGNAPAADDPFAALAAQAAVQQQNEAASQPITVTERTELAFKLVDPIEFDTSNSQDTESLITRALVVGKFDLAVDLCIKSARMADALVLAACGGPDLWARTQDRYFKQNRAPYMRLVASIVKDRLQDLVAQTKLRSWKGTLAVVCTYAKSDEFPVLCDFLGDRLMEEAGDSDSAVLCYMCAGNIEKTVAAWAKQAVGSRQGEGVAALVDLLEKVNIFRKAIDFKDMTEVLAVKYSQYAEALAAQGQLPAAMKYLAFLSDPKFDTLTGRDGAVLLDRVYHALGGRGPAPPTPFGREEVQPDQRLLYSQQQQQQPVQSTPTQPTYGGASGGTPTRNFGGPVPSHLGGGAPSHMGGAPSHMGGGAPSHMGGGAPSHMGGGAPSHMGGGAPSHMGGAPSHMGGGAPSHMGGGAPSHMGGGHPSSFGHSGGAPSHMGGGAPSHMGGASGGHPSFGPSGGAPPPSHMGGGGHPSAPGPSPYLSGGGAPSHMGGGGGGGHPSSFGGAPSHMGGGAPSHMGGASGGHPSFVGGAGAPSHPSYVGGGAAAPPVGPPPAGSGGIMGGGAAAPPPAFGSGPSSFPMPTAHTGGFGGSPAPSMGGATAPQPSHPPLSREKTPPASLERPVGEKGGPSIPSNTHLKTKEEKPAGSGQPTAVGTEAINKYGSLLDTYSVQFSSDPRKGKMVHDAKSRLEPLFNKLRNGELSNGAETALVQLASALERGDKGTAHAMHKEASGKYWEELTSPVMIGLKRLIDVL